MQSDQLRRSRLGQKFIHLCRVQCSQGISSCILSGPRCNSSRYRTHDSGNVAGGGFLVNRSADEHRSQVRTGSAPQIMAAPRNLIISVIRLAGKTNIAAALRRHAAQPSRPLALIGAVYK